MDKIPSLDELLDYGDEYKYPDLIMSDYFKVDNNKRRNNNDNQLNKNNDQLSEDVFQDQSLEQSNEEVSQDQRLEQSNEELSQDQRLEQSSDEISQDQNLEQSNEELSQDQSLEQSNEELSQDQSLDQSSENVSQDQSLEQSNEKLSQDQSLEQSNEEVSQDQSLEQSSDEISQDQSSEQSNEELSQDQNLEQSNEENNFDDLMNNYEENTSRQTEDGKHEQIQSVSDKINKIYTTEIYRVLKKLVSLSYERYQKGTYKYDKKEIVKHYLTNQKFKIIDDLVSPIFKPDVYVFDLSPSNDDSLEMYVNAISSVAIKNSLIYLTYNEYILRKLLIKKENSRGIDVRKIVNSNETSYNNFECTIFNEYYTLYEELSTIKDRKIYIFSDFDIARDITKLSKDNPDIVWFSTEKIDKYSSFFKEYPISYLGYYVETSGIGDIEKYIKENNKNKYKRRFM